MNERMVLIRRRVAATAGCLAWLVVIGGSVQGTAAAEPKPVPAEPPRDARTSETRSAETLSAWKFFAEVPVAAVGKTPLTDVVLPPSVFDAARVDLADLRLYDDQLRDVPYALRVRSEVDTTEAVPATEFNRVPDSSGSGQLSLDLGEKQIEHNEVEINTPGDNFRRRVLLEGSDEGNSWNKLVEDFVVCFPSGEKPFIDKTLTYTPSRYRYLRITLNRDPQDDNQAIDIGEVVVRRRVKVPGELDVRQVPFGEREPVRADGGPGSRWAVDLQGSGVPVDRLLVAVADDAFVRNYYIEAGGPAGTNERFWRVTSGVWQRRAGEPKQDLVAEFGQEVLAARLRLVVTDNRNPALQLEAVKAAAPARVVIAQRAESPGGPWRLYFGNPKAESPNYDFARNLPQRIAPPPDRLSLGSRQENPAYEPIPLPLTERLPWLIYVLLSAAVAVLALLIANLARASIQIADLREGTA